MRHSTDSSAEMVGPSSPAGGGGGLRTAVEGSPAVVVCRRGCCMAHVVKRLLQGLGVNPAAWEVVSDAEEAALWSEIGDMLNSGGGGEGGRCPAALPVMFIGGRYVGELGQLMAAHISGDLVPILKEAGALWL